MSFWLIKARRSRTDLTMEMATGRVQRWRTRRPPRGWKPTDGVFLWQAAPDLQLRGVGTIVDIPDPVDGEAFFDVRYEHEALGGPGIAELRAHRELEGASFLKAGAAGTVFPLTARQAQALTESLPAELSEWSAAVRAADQEPEMAISIRQPYAELILRGIKTTEFRPTRTKRRGSVLIYAALQPGPADRWAEHGLEVGSLPTGVVVGQVDILTCVELGKRSFGYRLANAKRLPHRKPERHPQPSWFRPW